jgi:hypothetical protein
MTRICKLEECGEPFEPKEKAHRQEFCCQKHHDRYWYLERKAEGEFEIRNEMRREIREVEKQNKKAREAKAKGEKDVPPEMPPAETLAERVAAKEKLKQMFPEKGPELRRMNGHAVDDEEMFGPGLKIRRL